MSGEFMVPLEKRGERYESVCRPCDDGYLNFEKIKTAHLWNAREDWLRKQQLAAKTVATKSKPA